MDSWEDDDADVTLPGAVAPSSKWDDEEEEDEVETVAAAPQSSSNAEVRLPFPSLCLSRARAPSGAQKTADPRRIL